MAVRSSPNDGNGGVTLSPKWRRRKRKPSVSLATIKEHTSYLLCLWNISWKIQHNYQASCDFAKMKAQSNRKKRRYIMFKQARPTQLKQLGRKRIDSSGCIDIHVYLIRYTSIKRVNIQQNYSGIDDPLIVQQSKWLCREPRPSYNVCFLELSVILINFHDEICVSSNTHSYK